MTAPHSSLSLILTHWIDACYFPFFRRWFPLQTFRYAVCGSSNMGFDLLLYFILYNFILDRTILYLPLPGLSFSIAISPHIAAWLIVTPITFFTGFWLNRHIAFHGSPLRGQTQLFRYLLSLGGSILISYACLKFFVEVLGIYPTPSKALTLCISVAYSYLMQKHYTFRGCDKL